MNSENKTQVKQRQLAFDNNSFSERHRKYGKQLYAFDIDMFEFNKNKQPIIMYETKYGYEIYKEIDLNSFQIQSQLNIANPLNIPFFLLLYFFPGTNEANGKVNEFGKFHTYYLIPINDQAKAKLKSPKYLTEYQFVWFIYKLKNEEMPDNLNLDHQFDWTPPPLKLKESQ